ncbi:GNAT family N-acetyltransferase [Chitinophaga sp. NPDC101104]|uniref:GNAT family N-acetyltransferase n=1 Tax=Chitinophaga sp. NPDC101104 TaxID=3390561 RepID=UPI003D0379ED
MNWSIRKASLQDILPLRPLYLQESNFQIRYNARHERGWTDSYLISTDGSAIGYGAVAGKNDHGDRDSLFEFYLVPPFRHLAAEIFAELLRVSGVTEITCQTNDLFFASLFYRFARNIRAEAFLFSEQHTTYFRQENRVFRKRQAGEVMNRYEENQMGGYVVVADGKPVATGDFYLHYNPPFADLWMEVMESHRRKGIGSYLLQELKTACYLAGRIPAARCNIDNEASKASLLKAGLQVAGCLVSGDVIG